MSQFADSVQNLITEFRKLPGVGERTAERFVFFLLKQDKEEALKLADAITDVKTSIHNCSVCHNITDSDPCRICSNPSRDETTICVVEQPSDLSAIEATGHYRGLYHVLLGTLSPLKGIGPDQIKVKDLASRVKKGNVREVIVATDSDTEGETTALYIDKLLAPVKVTVTRLARGIPVGGTLELAGGETITRAMQGRVSFGQKKK